MGLLFAERWVAEQRSLPATWACSETTGNTQASSQNAEEERKRVLGPQRLYWRKRVGSTGANDGIRSANALKFQELGQKRGFSPATQIVDQVERFDIGNLFQTQHLLLQFALLQQGIAHHTGQ